MDQQLPEPTIQPDDIAFNYDEASNVLNDLTLDTFFVQNAMPSVRTYPSIETFKSGFVAMNEKLYKSIKEKREEHYLRTVEHHSEEAPAKFEHNFKRNHLAVLDGRRVSRKLKQRLRRSAMKYCHSQSIIRLFKSYFVLVEYHHRSASSYPQIMDQYLKTIFAVFGSVKREKMQDMLREISSSPKMLGFYHDLYSLWEEEGSSAERSCLFVDIH